MQTQKHTAWKKNRKFGDVMGGRKRPKLADRIFSREHNLTAPAKGVATPIYIVDNPSRDFYFPVTVDEVKEILKRLPEAHTAHLTHIWFQKIKKTDHAAGNTFQASFICGSSVYLIVLHPFPVDNIMRLGKLKPTKRILNYYKAYTTVLKEDRNGWYLLWTRENIKQYYLESLLLHEIGHSIDSFYKRYWSKAAANKREKWADNYVEVWADQVREQYDAAPSNEAR
jgi:hypothetical protein